ncbi:hypothetical protein BpHYR1_033530 [Brachionus plicatilis]|uniref:Uncharacterized protein n=1 Tax=Brachionus plicatilis TaxID=10195 RepID=A0A3M7SGG2_BRAPC|nr:hypothetical protein BpHYR1_033530 [Brachionus plicatilis]
MRTKISENFYSYNCFNSEYASFLGRYSFIQSFTSFTRCPDLNCLTNKNPLQNFSAFSLKKKEKQMFIDSRYFDNKLKILCDSRTFVDMNGVVEEKELCREILEISNPNFLSNSFPLMLIVNNHIEEANPKDIPIFFNIEDETIS